MNFKKNKKDSNRYKHYLKAFRELYLFKGVDALGNKENLKNGHPLQSRIDLKEEVENGFTISK